ncbi:protein yellow-like [Cloeon dipterum]|uniref:protein yellow-like n=1 Tax=Cloeon dipterum TaxID=197152 RepID=UPI0032202AB3
MTPFFGAIFMLGLPSLMAAAANFTQVFEWPYVLDYEWPSEARRAQALEDGTFNPAKIHPRYMAVYGTRLFLTLYKEDGVPATLVSLQTSSESSEPPKLTPFPSWDMHLNGSGNCNKIQGAQGLEVDSVGRLWVLDQESSNSNCSPKLWIYNLNNNETELIHPFSFHDHFLHDLVIDETANNETFAYIALWLRKHIVVFSLERNQSWIVDMIEVKVNSIALSPKKDQEPRQLYLGRSGFKELYSIPVAELHNGTTTAEPELIANWTAYNSYRMLMDNHGTLYSGFMYENFTSTWNTSQPFMEQPFHQVAGLRSSWPLTFALDQNGTFWMAAFNNVRIPKFRLLKAPVGAKSYIYEVSPQNHESDTA